MPQDMYAPIKIILAAYQQGVEERQEREKLKQQKEMEGERRKVEREQLKSLSDYRKEEKERFDAQQKLNNIREKREWEEYFRRHGAPQQQLEGIPKQYEAAISPQSGLRINPYEVAPGFSIDTSTIPLKGWQQQQLESSQDLRQSISESQLASRKEIAEALKQGRVDVETLRGETSRENSRLNAAVHLITSQLAANARGGRSDSNFRAYQGIIGKVQTDPIYKSYIIQKDNMDYVSKIKPDLSAPGIDDIKLVYTFMRSLDESVVRPSEVQMAAENASSFLQRMGIKFKRITSNSILISPAGRKAIIEQVEGRYGIAKARYKDRLKAMVGAARLVDKDVDPISLYAAVLDGEDLLKDDQEKIEKIKSELPSGWSKK